MSRKPERLIHITQTHALTAFIASTLKRYAVQINLSPSGEHYVVGTVTSKDERRGYA